MTIASQIPVLSASSINKSFNALVVLNQVNFVVGEREAVGIVGPNGAGKTTLLNVLAGAYQPSAGTVAFRGQDITDLPVEDRCRKGIARSHQIPRPFGGMTVFENLFVAAANGGGFRREPSVRSLHRRAQALRNGQTCQSPGGSAGAAGSQAIGTRARDRHQSGGVAVGRDWRRADRRRSIRTGRDDSDHPPARRRHRVDRAYRSRLAAGLRAARLHECRA